ncbi:MAG: signal peptidase II [Deltaproteobacteria bacterium]|nr:signal peptidase II [Deltaproteobacteria bacterium]MBW1951616.1 signal peptidase II [Deltaproteobacteria bacterium]MBW1986633.1 signal peptidase II [Deltaproteobacteria bacterium]MBW2134766.1 signal peptidase II [Deltaproteobacteria bacterium]
MTISRRFLSPKYRLLMLIVGAGVGLDQLSKAVICLALSRFAIVPVIPGFFNLVHVHNRGAAFGLLANWPEAYASIFFSFATLIVLAVLAYLFFRLPGNDYWAATGYSLIIAGALGNLIDRVRLGEVIDFLDFYVGRYHWPAFNVADSLICLGAGLLCLVIWRAEGHDNVSHPV